MQPAEPRKALTSFLPTPTSGWSAWRLTFPPREGPTPREGHLAAPKRPIFAPETAQGAPQKILQHSLLKPIEEPGITPASEGRSAGEKRPHRSAGEKPRTTYDGVERPAGKIR